MTVVSKEVEAEGLFMKGNISILTIVDSFKDSPLTKLNGKLNDCLEYILDITIGYPNGKPLDLPNIVHGLRNPCQTYLFYRLYRSSEVSISDSACLG